MIYLLQCLDELMEQLTGSTYTIGEAGDQPRRLLLVGNSGSREDPVMYSLSYGSIPFHGPRTFSLETMKISDSQKPQGLAMDLRIELAGGVALYSGTGVGLLCKTSHASTMVAEASKSFSDHHAMLMHYSKLTRL